MSTQELDETIQEFRRKRKKARLTLVLLVTAALAGTIAILAYSSYHARRAEDVVFVVKLKLDTIALDLLNKVQALDGQTRELSHNENPTLYVWRGGLHPPKAKQNSLGRSDPKLIHLLTDRKSLLRTAGPA